VQAGQRMKRFTGITQIQHFVRAITSRHRDAGDTRDWLKMKNPMRQR
jgi:hypothetical protein